MKQYVALQSYLHPALSANPGQLQKYKKFALRLLQQCTTSIPITHDASRRRVLLALSDQCCTLLQMVHGVSGNYAKLLLHLAKACICVDEITRGISYCSMLHSALTDTRTGDNGLLKYVFDILCRGANELAKKGTSKEDCLEVRKKALLSLLCCHDYDPVFALEHVMKTEHFFLGSSSLPSTSHHVAVLHCFHTTIIPSPADMLQLPSSCSQVIAVAQYLLHRVVLATKAGQEPEGRELLQLYGGVMGEHEDVCKAAHHWPVFMQARVVRLWKSISGSPVQW